MTLRGLERELGGAGCSLHAWDLIDPGIWGFVLVSVRVGCRDILVLRRVGIVQEACGSQDRSIQLQKALTGNKSLYQRSLEDTAKGLHGTAHGKTSFQNPPKSLFLKVPHHYNSSPNLFLLSFFPNS